MSMSHPNPGRDHASGTTTNGVVVDLHVWRLDETASARMAGFLSADETARALRFVSERDRQRFIVGRARLRQILARYMGVAPGAVTFAYGENGKPHLSHAGPAPHFNLSHSADLAAAAVCWECELGVDVEHIRPIEPGVAERFFSASENAELAALQPADWLRGFFRCWTRKEAVVKALGVGLMQDITALSVSLAPDAPRVLRLEGDDEAPGRWSLVEALSPGTTLLAVAARTDGRPISLRRECVTSRSGLSAPI